MGIVHEPGLEAIASSPRRPACEFEILQIANTAWAISSLHFEHKPLRTALAVSSLPNRAQLQRCVQHERSASPSLLSHPALRHSWTDKSQQQQRCNLAVAWSFSHAGCYPSRLVDQLREGSLHGIESGAGGSDIMMEMLSSLGLSGLNYTSFAISGLISMIKPSGWITHRNSVPQAHVGRVVSWYLAALLSEKCWMGDVLKTQLDIPSSGLVLASLSPKAFLFYWWERSLGHVHKCYLVCCIF